MKQADFAERLADAARLTGSALDVVLASGEKSARRPDRLMAAMRHAATGGGKRLRPFLAMETARAFGGDADEALTAGVAVELVHCYSLVHDDLPSMDNDDMRRGKPTVHRAFDEATAILAGDGLLTLAFGILADPARIRSAARRAALVAALADGAGIDGMVGGQQHDLAAEGRFGEAGLLNTDGVILIQSMKTGALIRAACLMGAIVGRARAPQRAAVIAYAEALGLAFQIKDDLLDAESDAVTLGKAAGKDAAAGKSTFVSLLGVSGAKLRLDAATAAGESALARLDGETGGLAGALAFNRDRSA
jgi:farnesyl diphosphate synthase